ncbi:hypothetical protein L2E82_05381 [Cichorium intybus]|uniref:Uncharacterized protein n=1 Tax=Cichorium intybus TaxID=13427 RepID=A0ACB9H9D7_CICIN|nr:hypothetical protein L2E82_05381 [Cichorium intybus]
MYLFRIFNSASLHFGKNLQESKHNLKETAKEYGSCVAAKVPQIERDMCLKEFLKLKNCMQSVLKGKP